MNMWFVFERLQEAMMWVFGGMAGGISATVVMEGMEYLNFMKLAGSYIIFLAIISIVLDWSRERAKRQRKSEDTETEPERPRITGQPTNRTPRVR